MADRFSVLICGAGYVGSALGTLLQKGGHEVWALRRDPSRAPPGLRPVHGDLTRLETLRHLPAALDHVVFCASPGESSDEAYRRLYVEGLSNVVTAVSDRTRTPRIYFTSSTAVYAQEDGSWVNETSVTAPTRFSGIRTLEAEQVLAQSGLRTTVLRCSGIYGPGRQSMVQGLKAGRLRLPRDDRYTNRIHRDDVAGVLAYLMTTGKEVERLLVNDDEPALYSTVVNTLAERLGVPLPSVDPDMPPTRFGGNKRCDNALLRKLGYELRYPTFREGYAELG